MVSSASKAFFLASFLGLGLGAAAAQDSPEPGAKEPRVVFVSVAEDGTTIVDCLGTDCETEDCSGNENLVDPGVPIRMRRLEGNACASEALTLDEAQEFEEAQLEIDDILLIGSGPDGGQGPGGGGNGGPIDIDIPFLHEDEVNQQQVGDTGNDPPVSPNKLGAPN